MNCRYSKLTPILTTDSSLECVDQTVDQTVETDFYDTSLMNDNTETEDNTDLNNEKLLLQKDIYTSENYFGIHHNLKGLPPFLSFIIRYYFDIHFYNRLHCV